MESNFGISGIISRLKPSEAAVGVDDDEEGGEEPEIEPASDRKEEEEEGCWQPESTPTATRPWAPTEEKPSLRVLELYAGIGGMHCALNRCFKFSEVVKNEIPFSSFEVVAAVDVNEVAASVYGHNFPSVKYLGSGVERFTVAELEALRFDMVTMSPPCQPFTRQGLKMDEEDARTKSFFHFLSLLETMSSRGTAPKFVVVENVYGFETSATRQKLVDTLGKGGFMWREFLLTPTQFGIPNSRLRYFLIGKRGGGGGGEASPSTFTETSCERKEVAFFLSNDPSSLLKEVPKEAESFRHHRSIYKNVTAEDLDSISTFLDETNSEYDKYLIVPDKLLKRFMVMDITYPHSKRSCCFTKAYGHYVDGTGSFLQTNQYGPTRDSVYEKIKQSQSKDASEVKEETGQPPSKKKKKFIKLDVLTEDDMSSLRDLKLRYFSPSEIARLHCLSYDFGFPNSVTLKQRWKVLGNGLNAHVVAVMMRLLLQQ